MVDDTQKTAPLSQAALDDAATTAAILPRPDEDDTPAPGSQLRQYFVATAATMGAFAGGTTLGWPSAAVPMLEHSLGISKEEGSWIVSLLALGAMVGAPPSGLLVQTVGRKVAVASLALPFILSYVLLLSVSSLPWIYVARFLAGMALGGVCLSIPIYVAEIAEDHVRGALGALLQVMFNIGLLFAYAVGAADNYLVLNASCLLVPILFFAAFVWMPESPVFLLSKGRTSEAHRALQWLRGPLHNTQFEMQKLEAAALEDARQKTSWRSTVTNRATVRALVISLGLVAFQQLSGVCVVFSYTEKIFEMAGSSLSPSLSAVLVGLVMLAMSYVTTVLVDRTGRKVLLLSSSVLMAVAHGLLGLYLALSPLPGWSWLPLFSVLLYISMYCAGLGPLPWTVMAEVLPANVKGQAGSLVSCFCWALSFAVTKVFVNLEQGIGLHFTFWLFGLCCAFSAVFVALMVPETKGKSLQQIQEELEGRKKIPRIV
ncbi:facilitated trehalose transporter Tret1 isoform X2 [Anabrus simplex]|uniref:facilitated trehalose transporter Tret1 isoform X2 n=1 Tax=Anabrus simplex TaxID=316456 RepID=UPI0035A37E69